MAKNREAPVFERYIKRVIGKDQKVAFKTVDILNTICLYILKQVSISAAQLAKKQRRMTLSPKDVVMAARFILPGELADYAAVNIEDAIEAYENSKKE